MSQAQGVAMLSALLTVAAAAADETPGVGPSRETVVAGAKYDKSGSYRFLFSAVPWARPLGRSSSP